jgi:hypothetical protein
MKIFLFALGSFAALLGACGGSKNVGSGFSTDGGGNGPTPDASMGFGDMGMGNFGDTGPTMPGGDPTTCTEAAAEHSYIGCDYWPTVVANNVWSIFDFTAVVANAGTQPASVTVTGNGQNQQVMVQPGQLEKIYLPWVASLKGADSDNCGEATPLQASVTATNSAYHLVSSVPVTVYQFNALEYQGMGGAPNKDWSSCPGSSPCSDPEDPAFGTAIGCFSFTNDASLLLPTTAMTGNYRVTGDHGWTAQDPESGMSIPVMGSYFAVTGTQAGTSVTVHLSSTGTVLAGGSVPAASPGTMFTFSLNAGDVAEIVSPLGDTYDFSGSLVQATNPVQVISGSPCMQTPETAEACDHLEQSVFPAETLGTHYIVTVPTSPHQAVIGHNVRIYGNFNGTTLTYSPSMPAGCAATIDAGQVVDCGIVSTNFEVTGTQSFAVGTFMLGGSLADPNAQPPNQEGDPSESMFASVEQFRSNYIFLAPNDYEESYVDIVAAPGTSLTLDGAPVTASAQAVGTGAYGIIRVALGQGQNGAHSLTASEPIGIQVIGYGAYTSYQYPGGLDLAQIAPPPPM